MKNIKDYVYNKQYNDLINLTKEQFIEKYKKENDFIYITKAKPCKKYEGNYSFAVDFSNDENEIRFVTIFDDEMIPYFHDSLRNAIKDYLDTII